MIPKRVVSFAAVGLLVSSVVFAQAAEMHVLREAVGAKTFAAAPRIAADAQLAPAVTLAAAAVAAPEKLDEIRAWNASGRQPARNGFVRSLHDAVDVQVGALASKSGAHGRGVMAATENGVAWGTSFRVENANRLRLHLEAVQVPEGTTFWVYGASGAAKAFDSSLVGENGSLWTPAVDGEVAYLELEVPAGARFPASFRVREVLELLSGPRRSRGDDEPTCLVNQDVNCQNSSEFSAISQASRAVAYMEFVSGGSGGVCSGALITDQQKSGTPYFLTANHCIANQSEASSLATYFDYKYESCVSSNVGFLPEINGSTLLVTSETSDVTLLRLPSLPANRVLLGWDTAVPASGTPLHRISHPVPDGFNSAEPQTYSRTTVTSTGANCTTRPRPNYVYSNESPSGEGGVYGGSSGSAAMLSTGQIVGQLLGSCGPDPAAGCDRRNNTLDGAFTKSFDLLKTYLSSTGTQPQPCTPNSSTICIVDNRFAVRIMVDKGNGLEPMTAIKYTANSGLFWFSDSSNIEVLLKMVNACVAPFNRFWVYAGGTTDQGVSITVTDSKTGTVWTKTHNRGTPFQTVTDSNAFATCP